MPRVATVALRDQVLHADLEVGAPGEEQADDLSEAPRARGRRGQVVVNVGGGEQLVVEGQLPLVQALLEPPPHAGLVGVRTPREYGRHPGVRTPSGADAPGGAG